MLIAKTCGIWFLFLIIAVANGLLRDAVIIPLAGDAVAHGTSSVLFAMIIFFITLGLIRFIGVSSRAQCWLVGGLWFVMTVAFEFLFFHYIAGTPWDVLLADYNVLKGRLWVLVLMSTILSPFVAARIRGIV